MCNLPTLLGIKVQELQLCLSPKLAQTPADVSATMAASNEWLTALEEPWPKGKEHP